MKVCHFIKDLLSRRLLSNWCAGTSEESEIKNLELLKLRFGEDNMGKCAVMLKVGFFKLIFHANCLNKLPVITRMSPTADVSTHMYGMTT